MPDRRRALIVRPSVSRRLGLVVALLLDQRRRRGSRCCCRGSDGGRRSACAGSPAPCGTSAPRRRSRPCRAAATRGCSSSAPTLGWSSPSTWRLIVVRVAEERLGGGRGRRAAGGAAQGPPCWSTFRDGLSPKISRLMASASRKSGSARSFMPLILERAAQLHERDRDVLVLVAENAAGASPAPLRAAARRPRHRRARAAGCPSSLSDCARRAVAAPSEPPANRQGLLEQRLRGVEQPEALVHPADHVQHLGLQLGLIGELLLHALGAGIEDVADGRLAVARRIGVGAGEEAGQQLAHPRGLVGLEPRAIALGGEPHRVEGHERGHQHHGRRRSPATTRARRCRNFEAR